LARLSVSRVIEGKVRSIDIHTMNAYIVADLLNRTLTVLTNQHGFGNDSNASYR